MPSVFRLVTWSSGSPSRVFVPLSFAPRGAGQCVWCPCSEFDRAIANATQVKPRSGSIASAPAPILSQPPLPPPSSQQSLQEMLREHANLLRSAPVGTVLVVSVATTERTGVVPFWQCRIGWQRIGSRVQIVTGVHTRLLNCRCEYVSDFRTGADMVHPSSQSLSEMALTTDGDAGTLFLTSPTYYSHPGLTGSCSASCVLLCPSGTELLPQRRRRGCVW